MKLVFIDRDGVINKYPGHGKYVLDRDSLIVFPFVKDALSVFKQYGFFTVVVSNQACVSKGFISEESLVELTDYMLAVIEEDGYLIDRVFYCTHQEQDNCYCRKPSPGMIEKALDLFKDKGSADYESVPFFIGDSIIDVKTARNAGLRSILVLTGRESLDNRHAWEVQPDFTCRDLLEASGLVVSQG